MRTQCFPAALTAKAKRLFSVVTVERYTATKANVNLPVRGAEKQAPFPTEDGIRSLEEDTSGTVKSKC